jgi:hypothetical protein
MEIALTTVYSQLLCLASARGVAANTSSSAVTARKNRDVENGSLHLNRQSSFAIPVSQGLTNKLFLPVLHEANTISLADGFGPEPCA